MRTLDGRQLLASRGGGNFSPLVADSNQQPAQWQTFGFVTHSARRRLSSGGAISLGTYTLSWIPAGFLVRVDHNTISVPAPNHGTPLVTYEIGGRDACVYVMEEMPPGYPGYRPGDPAESTFNIIKLVNGVVDNTNSAIQNGDHIAIRITSNRGNTFFFRVSGRQNGAEVHGDGIQPGEEGTIFIVELVEVGNGLGLRPPVVKCRSCASVSVIVTDPTGRPVSGARVVAQVPNHLFTGTTGADGKTLLRDIEGGSCVPEGSVLIDVTHDRRQTKSILIAVPDSGGIQPVVQLECTLVSGMIHDDQGFGLPGEEVSLTDENGAAITDESGLAFVKTTANDGTFSFSCVPHRFVRVMTGADPSQLHHIRFIPPEGWTDVNILVPTPCFNVVGSVIDLDTDLPISGAMVRENRGRLTFARTDGCFTFVCLKPSEIHSLVATASGYGFGFNQATVPKGIANNFDCRNLPANPADIHVIYLSRVVVTRIRIVLTWGPNPLDLDLHTSWPDSIGGRFHVYYLALSVAAAPYVTLDNDDTNGRGREEITIEPTSNGSFVPTDYRVWVQNFYQEADPSSTFGRSSAKVEIFQDNQLGYFTPIGSFLVANAAGNPHNNLWHVVDMTIDVNGLVAQNVVQSLIIGPRNTVL